MAIPAEYGPLVVLGWLLVAVVVGCFTIVQMMRRRVIPVTPAVVAFSMGIGGLVLFPASLLNVSAIALLKWFLIFILADMVVMSLVIRFQVKK